MNTSHLILTAAAEITIMVTAYFFPFSETKARFRAYMLNRATKFIIRLREERTAYMEMKKVFNSSKY